MGVPEKIESIQEELHRTKINKATEHHVGLLKAKHAKLKQNVAENHGKASSISYAIKRSGDATVTLIGLPSVGKSTLLNRLTNAKSKIGSYHFTTLKVIPGIMEFKGSRIQVLDLPGIIKGASTGKGLGKKVLSVVRSSDLVLLILEIFQPKIRPVLINELRNIGIHPDEQPPKIKIEKTGMHGISVNASVRLTKITTETVKKVFRIYNIHNARVMINEDVSYDQLIAVLLQNHKYIPTLTIMNKIDLVSPKLVNELKSRLNYDYIPISADANLNIDILKEKIYQKLGFIRVFMRPKGKKTDYEKPMIVKSSASVLDVCDKVHRKMKYALRYTQIWRKSVKFDGQKVGVTHHLKDEDVITFVTK
ncbi:MAG: GTP-binding protein [Candidatus Bathyarchaeota archaeon]|nr:GTP-binding protein [Candidatus Bathyarchaeota archaeon]